MEISSPFKNASSQQQFCQEKSNKIGTKVTARTKDFLKNWRNLTTNQFVLKIVSGIRLKFLSPPKQTHIPCPIKFDTNEIVSIDEEIRTLLLKRAIIPVDPTTEQFKSNIFTRPKKSGGLRTIINLKRLNKHLEKIHFKMEHIMTILPLIKQGIFMTSLDLKDAYFSLPIAKQYKKYLRFIWKDQLYEYQCLCFGLNLAPFYFTKVMKPIFSQLRHEGINCTYYIDDSLYLNHSAKKLEADTNQAMTLLRSLGFIVNDEKSSLTPSQQIIHLGFVIDTVTYSVSLPDQKVDKMKEECYNLLKANKVTIRQFSKLIGLLVSSFLAVCYAQLHTRYLEIYKSQHLNKVSLTSTLSIYQKRFVLSLHGGMIIFMITTDVQFLRS